jgi:hypothetical protein
MPPGVTGSEVGRQIPAALDVPGKKGVPHSRSCRMLDLAWATLGRVRIQLHLLRALLLLRAAPGARCPHPSRRARTLEQLLDYTRGGSFPQHGGAGKPRPVFVDHAGTHCAVAHLLSINSHEAVVARIAERQNSAYLADLAKTPGLREALSSLDLTPQDAAIIQPTYASDHWYAEDPGGGILPLVAMLLPLGLAFGSVLLTFGLILSQRGRQTFWSRSLNRRILTTSVLTLGLGLLTFTGYVLIVILA